MVQKYKKSRDTVEQHLRLDVSNLSSKDLFDEEGKSMEVHLRFGQGQKADHSVELTYESRNKIVVHYSSFDKPINLEWTEPHFGGQRPWFVCPNCDDRKRVLYGDARFHCRDCLDLTYESSNISDPRKIAIRKLKKIGKKLLPDQNLDYDSILSFEMNVPTHPDKPEQMNWKTYEGLICEWIEWRKKLKKEIAQDIADIAQEV